MPSDIEMAIKHNPADPYRLCINYIYLNSISEKGVGQLRRLDEVLQALAGRQVYSEIDGFSGYYCKPMDEDTIYLAGFIGTGISPTEIGCTNVLGGLSGKGNCLISSL
ncbi:hypothetical protein L211DRAFT_851028 [Terfezia boudieri ATCC MYA-4762]|uniref:Uncharacterized protein n=1 Tax=Terfezia boudieri ATCC MYA-4762 TaxID=1051890 RepID=A0A3N4LH41_9PEZI|nr:hypothetical protein L211DRAFT_886265 [Terfezia boudieri ATCC MYA-4762]RPB22049.1 hypothetical protein L211DRAFT_851028 [Terfezia boudieri ATCC MYA-4762]